MQFDRRWLIREFSPAFKTVAEIEAIFEQMGVGPNDTHVPFMVAFAITAGLSRNLNNEMCGLTDRSVPFGTWEMLMRSMSTASRLDKALFTLVQSSRAFNLPYDIDVYDQGDAVSVEIRIDGKKNPQSTYLEAAYARFIWASLCWFAGKQIVLLSISNKYSYYEADNRGSDGIPIRPFKSDRMGVPSLLVSNSDGFTFPSSDLYIKSAIRHESEPLLECLKWFGTLSINGINNNTDKNIIQTSKIQYKHEGEVFKKNVPYTFRDEQIIQAKILLSSTNKSISEIDFDAGFSSEQHFRRRFQKNAGETPTQYRERFDSGALLGSDHLLDHIIAMLK